MIKFWENKNCLSVYIEAGSDTVYLLSFISSSKRGYHYEETNISDVRIDVNFLAKGFII